jgi:outer membrane protein TolC
MAYIFDSLGYAKRLRDGGVPRDQAEAHAEAARDFITVELATKTDLVPIKADLQIMKSDLLAVKADVQGIKTDLHAVKADVQAVKTDVQTVKADLLAVKATVENQSLRLTVRLGAMIAVGIGVLAAILKLA